MRKSLLAIVIVSVAMFLLIGATTTKTAPQAWSMNGTIIEACSCPMFCQCYFNSEPAGHSEGMAMHSEH